MKVQKTCLRAIKKGVVNSAHDLSDGGLSVNVAESILNSKNGLGAHLSFDRKLRNDEALFGECQSVIVVTVSKQNLDKLTLISSEEDAPIHTIGRVTNDDKLIINDCINIKRDKLYEAYFNSLEKIVNE